MELNEGRGQVLLNRIQKIKRDSVGDGEQAEGTKMRETSSKHKSP